MGRIGFNRGIRRGDHPAERSAIHHVETVLFWIGALVLLFSHLAGKNGLKATMGKELELSDTVWNNLTYAWIAFLVFMGIANWFVFTHFESHWVNYKMFGSTGLMFAFFIAQGIYLGKHLPKEN